MDNGPLIYRAVLEKRVAESLGRLSDCRVRPTQRVHPRARAANRLRCCSSRITQVDQKRVLVRCPQGNYEATKCFLERRVRGTIEVSQIGTSSSRGFASTVRVLGVIGPSVLKPSPEQSATTIADQRLRHKQRRVILCVASSPELQRPSGIFRPAQVRELVVVGTPALRLEHGGPAPTGPLEWEGLPL
jgi:hypothetical protein